MIPPVYQFALLALAAFRVWRLLAEDDILDAPRRRLLHLNSRNEPAEDREEAALFLICPACAGFWISGVVYLLWLWLLGDYDTPSDILIGMGVVFAMNAVVIFLRRNLDPPED